MSARRTHSADDSLPDNGNGSNHDDFVFPAHAQLASLAGGFGTR